MLQKRVNFAAVSLSVMSTSASTKVIRFWAELNVYQAMVDGKSLQLHKFVFFFNLTFDKAEISNTK